MSHNFNVWWVNQGKTYKDELEHSLLWASDSKVWHHQTMRDVKIGDLIVHYADKKLVAFSVVLNEAFLGPREIGSNEWGDTGLILKTKYYPLDEPITLDKLSLVSQSIVDNQPSVHAPFNSKGQINQAYLTKFNHECLSILYKNFSKEYFSEQVDEVVRSFINELPIVEGFPFDFDLQKYIGREVETVDFVKKSSGSYFTYDVNRLNEWFSDDERKNRFDEFFSQIDNQLRDLVNDLPPLCVYKANHNNAEWLCRRFYKLDHEFLANGEYKINIGFLPDVQGRTVLQWSLRHWGNVENRTEENNPFSFFTDLKNKLALEGLSVDVKEVYHGETASVIISRGNLSGEGIIDLDYSLVDRIADELSTLYNSQKVLMESKMVNSTNNTFDGSPLPKPFLLLAGISGTGKTRFVREQAKRSCGVPYENAPENPDNLCVVAVRPDWHEPSDLLGYVSRINGTRYVATDFLKFMVKALIAAVNSANPVKEDGKLNWKNWSEVAPFWLCLDEMNLAPVEQYFADYLSVLESREWKRGEDNATYSSQPMLNASVFDTLKVKDKDGLDDQTGLKEFYSTLFDGITSESITDSFKTSLWNYFLENGIPLPPNLIVAGTVNMDETTHGFSRKVIDRALTLDFQEFFPNKYDDFFEPKSEPITFTFPTLSQIKRDEKKLLITANASEIEADKDGAKSVRFLDDINKVLKQTPFELAYRALNELLLSVACFKPKDDAELCAVWDDFLMQKVLPRIEGDAEKLKYTGDDESGILQSLKKVILDAFKPMLGEELVRPDLLFKRIDNSESQCAVKSLAKIIWMQDRLAANHYSSFWA